MSDIKYVRLEEEEQATVEEVAEHHASTMAAAIRFIIRDWKRLVGGKDINDDQV